MIWDGIYNVFFGQAIEHCGEPNRMLWCPKCHKIVDVLPEYKATTFFVKETGLNSPAIVKIWAVLTYPLFLIDVFFLEVAFGISIFFKKRCNSIPRIGPKQITCPHCSSPVQTGYPSADELNGLRAFKYWFCPMLNVAVFFFNIFLVLAFLIPVFRVYVSIPVFYVYVCVFVLAAFISGIIITYHVMIHRYWKTIKSQKTNDTAEDRYYRW